MLLAALAARRGTCGDELVDQVGTAWCMGKAVRLRYLTAEQVGEAADALSTTTFDDLVAGVTAADLDQAQVYPE